jgi:hypothetical protein
MEQGNIFTEQGNFCREQGNLRRESPALVHRIRARARSQGAIVLPHHCIDLLDRFRELVPYVD